MTPVRVICTLDGMPLVFPDGSIHAVVPGADVDLAEHDGQCEVREMVLASPPAGGHSLRRESSAWVSPEVEAVCEGSLPRHKPAKAGGLDTFERDE